MPLPPLRVPYFNPRSPCGERQERAIGSLTFLSFQPTLPVRGATSSVDHYTINNAISTHAPRAGSDPFRPRPRPHSRYFNPRSPCGERLAEPEAQRAEALFQPTLPVRGATGRTVRHVCIARFQPTLPVRGATADFNSMIGIPNDFNPRSPCGERPSCFLPSIGMTNFNPRSPCGERPMGQYYGFAYLQDFNPRSPCGERPCWK